jgi:hypothetical protein
MIAFISTSVTSFLNHTYYSAIADLHNLEFTVAHTLGFSVSTSSLLATDLNTETSTSNHSEVFLSSVTLYSSVLICTQLIFTIHRGHTPFSSLYSQVLCTNVSYNMSLLYRLRTDNTENTSHVIPSQRVHWRTDCCLATSYNIRPLRNIFHYCTLERVYRAVA